MIDFALLEKIAAEVALRRLAEDFRELIVYSGNKDLIEIYSRYIEEANKDEQPSTER